MNALIGIVIRGSVMYLYTLAVLRLSGKRTIGSVSPLDFAVATILGDMFDDVFWAEIPLAQGLVGMSTVALVHLLMVYATYKSIRLDRLLGAQRVPVVRQGRFDPDGLRRERLRREEVQSLLRERQVDQLKEVKEAAMESTGGLSVLRREEAKIAQRRDLSRLKELLP